MNSKSRLLILGAGKPHTGSHHSSLTHIDSDKNVLDWLLNSFSSIQLEDIRFIGGYRIQDIMTKYPMINYSINPRWKSSKNLESLLQVTQVEDCVTYVSYSDIVYPESSVNDLASTVGDIVFLGDSKWLSRYSNQDGSNHNLAEKYIAHDSTVLELATDIKSEDASGEYIGLAKFNEKGIALINEFKNRSEEELKSLSIIDLIHEAVKRKLDVKVIDIKGDWAEINKPEDITNYVIKTKAKTLQRLRPLLTHSKIADQVSFTVADWCHNEKSLIKKVQGKFGETPVIIRSSALKEDQLGQSMAGAFESVPNVNTSSQHDLKTSIDTVVNSYTEYDPDNQVLVQEMAQNIKKCGVVFTKTLNNGGPYYTINLDESGSTDAVTNGSDGDFRTFIIHRNFSKVKQKFGDDIGLLVNAVKEIEEKISYSFWISNLLLQMIMRC